MLKKKITFLLCFAFVWLTSQTLDVMSYNIRLSLPSDGENYWEKRKPDVLALLTYYNPVVFGVQEAVPAQVAELTSGLKKYSYLGVGREDGASKGEFSAIFYDKTQLKNLNNGTFWLSETPDIPSKGWDAAYNRVCTYGLFKTKKTGRKFWVFNLHFDHVGNFARQKSAELVLQKIREIAKSKHPIILMGDFNLTPEKLPIQSIIKSFQDSFLSTFTPHYGPVATFNGFNTVQIPQERIDYIFVRGFKVLSHRHINDLRPNLLYPSDHFPVFTNLNF